MENFTFVGVAVRFLLALLLVRLSGQATVDDVQER